MSESAIILIEHDRGQLKKPSLHAITLARQLGAPYQLLALGRNLDSLRDSISAYGAAGVLIVDEESLEHPIAERYAKVVADIARARGASTLLASSSTFSKDILPRVAALLDAPMLSDVLAYENGLFKRPIHAGNLIATVRLDSQLRVLTARATAFEAPAAVSNVSPTERIRIDSTTLPNTTEFISQEHRDSHRPDLSEARIVVGGGRPLKDKQTFDRLIGGLADTLHGAVASTRAAVDAGIASNDTQVGQTGKVIAPQLYISIGISGAIQHLAGVKDSRIIVAINKDPDAPIFQSATYGLVGDLHQIVPRLIELLKAG